MSEVTVNSSPARVNCPKYHPGHNTHWIPVLRLHTKTPRIPAQVRHVKSQEFVVTINGQDHNWFFHDPATLNLAIATNPTGFKSVKGSTFLNIALKDGGIGWFYMAKEPIEPCDQTDFKRYEDY